MKNWWNKNQLDAMMRDISLALVGGVVCMECGTDGEGHNCKYEEGQCHFLKYQRSEASDSVIDAFIAKKIALKYQKGPQT